MPFSAYFDFRENAKTNIGIFAEKAKNAELKFEKLVIKMEKNFQHNKLDFLKLQ